MNINDILIHIEQAYRYGCHVPRVVQTCNMKSSLSSQGKQHQFIMGKAYWTLASYI